MKTQYKLETHMHTSPVSICARNSGAEMARAYFEEGYDGIIVTDHFFNGNCGVPPQLCWEDRVHAFAQGYESAKEEGDLLGLSVFFGWEYNYKGTEFLTYGLDKSFLLKNPNILELSVEEYLDYVHASGGFIVHAHPFREAPYINEIRLYPDRVDAAEIKNARNTKEFNQKAVLYAKKHRLLVTGGSDCHKVEEEKRGGMIFDHKLESIFDFIDSVKNGSGRVIDTDL